VQRTPWVANQAEDTRKEIIGSSKGKKRRKKERRTIKTENGRRRESLQMKKT